MANPEHLAKLKEGVEAWNKWREENPGVKPELEGAHLSQNNLTGANLRDADLNGAGFFEADLSAADLSGADLSRTQLSKATLIESRFIKSNLRRALVNEAQLVGARLIDADLTEAQFTRAALWDADLSGAKLIGADLRKTDLADANLTGADLTRAKLSEARLVGTRLENANLTGCLIHGISAWDLNLKGAKQENLVITPYGEPAITVDNLEVAQFLYLLLYNPRVRYVIDTITSKVVLILGRFKKERKAVLDALREKLRKSDYIPVLFDFEKPASRDLTETISTLAHMARFVVADITDAKSIPQELQRIVPDLPSVPVVPLILGAEREYGMFEHFIRFPWVLDVYHYDAQDTLIEALPEKVITPAEEKAKELQPKPSRT